jgi:aldehyde dehydrogenase (NAD+)
MPYDGPTQLYVDGEWTDPVEGGELTTIDPATEEPYATVAKAAPADVDRAVAAASEAATRGSEWRTMDPKERASALQTMADHVEAHEDEIIAVESDDNGKTPFEASLDVGMVVDTLRYFAGWADKIEGSQIPVPGERLNYTVREPMGVTAHVPPWNYPFQLAGRSVAPALAAGNSVVLKPSSETPLSALYYAEAAEAAGLPDGVLNVVPGTGREAGEALVGHDDVDHVAFTGSTGVGKHVMQAAADTVTDVTLELGGKGPNVVLPDADLDAAAKGVQYGIFMNAGQMCWAGSRLVVHEAVHDEVVEKVVDIAESIPLGTGVDDGGRMGPLVNEEQYEDVLGYVETGKAEGATLAAGGGTPSDRDEGYFVEPTVFTDVTNDMTIAREEIFGPVLSVVEVADREEAIAVANDSPYGLLAGVWTSDLQAAHDTADRLDYGMVSVNEYPVTHPQTPFGGVKESGLGREQGSEAIREYTQVKNVNVNLG